MRLKELGYNVIPIERCPFDALTKDNKVIIITGIGIGRYNEIMLEKAKVMTNLSKITERYSVYFVEKCIEKQNLEGTPLIGSDELNKIEGSEDILELIFERRAAP
jgi:putative transcriptional regulator